MTITVNVSIRQDPTVLATLIHLHEDIKEIKRNMPSIQDVKDAVGLAAQQTRDAITAAVQKETGEVITAIQALPTGQPITQADLDDIVNKVLGIATAATGAIDSISTNAVGTVPIPPTPPVEP